MASYDLEEKYRLIKQALLKEKSKNPLVVVQNVMKKRFISLHGPEHHLLDGGAFLTAYRNAGGDIDLLASLDELASRTSLMPGAMCGYWGVCGASTSIGAALSILHKTSPLSTDAFYADNMEFTSTLLNEMSHIGGPRCCKRNAFLALTLATSFVKKKYGIVLETGTVKCEYASVNETCIKERCPFYDRQKSKTAKTKK